MDLADNGFRGDLMSKFFNIATLTFLLFSCVDNQYDYVAESDVLVPEIQESEAFESEVVELAFESQEDDTLQFSEEKRDKLKKHLELLFKSCSEEAIVKLKELLTKIDSKIIEIEQKLATSRLEKKEYERLNKILDRLEKFEERILQWIQDCKDGQAPGVGSPMPGDKLTCDKTKKLKEKLIERKDKLLEKLLSEPSREKLKMILERLEEKLNKIEEKLKDC